MSQQVERYMDHDDKIKPKFSFGREIFLREDYLQEASKHPVYNLEDEFAKTRRNRNILIYLGIIAFIAFLGILTVTITSYVETQSKKVQLGISEFEDDYLKEVLSAARNGETMIAEADRVIQDLQRDMEKELAGIRSKKAEQLGLIRSSGLSPDDEAAAVNDLDKKEKADITRVQNFYADKISKKQAEIEELQKDTNNIDRKMMDDARKKGIVVMDDNAQLREIELQKMRIYYNEKMRVMENSYRNQLDNMRDYYSRYISSLILKYNPVITNYLKGIIESPMPDSVEYSPGQRGFRDTLAVEGAFSRGAFLAMRARISNFYLLFGRMLQVPYTNSVPGAFRQMNYLSLSVIGDYELLWSGLADAVDRKNAMLDQYRSALSYYAKVRKENGYVVDPRNPDSMVVFIDGMYQIREGDVALVFRNDNEYIGKIRLTPTRECTRAKVVEIDETNHVQPFDKILLQLH